MRRYLHTLAGLASALVTLWFATDVALACACCTNRAGRHVDIEKLSAARLDTIEQMTFAAQAFVGQSAADHPIDLQDFGPALQLAVTRTKTEIVFAFRGDAGRASEVTFTLPTRSQSSKSIRAAANPTPAWAPPSTRNGN